VFANEKPAVTVKRPMNFRTARQAVLVCGLFAVVICCTSLVLSAQEHSLVFTNINVFNGGTVQPAMTVIVRGGRIEAVAKSATLRIPAGSQVIASEGKFMIPGLWDMHVHLTDAKVSAIPALVANGITGVRDMGSLLPKLDDWRLQIERGNVVGPRILRAGPILNGQSFGPTHLAVADAAEARGAVRALAHIGVDFIKVHAALTRDEFFAVADEAKRAGLPFSGHIPVRVSPAEVSDAGQASIEHTESLFVGTAYARMPREEMFTAMASLFQRFAKNDTFYTPTLIMYKSSADWRDFVAHPEDQYVARSAQEAMRKASEAYRNAPEIVAGRKRVLQDLILLVGMMRQNAVKVMVGTDLADGRIFPGFSLHEELALLVEAGLTPAEAIAAATRVPAEFLKLRDTGTIEAGQRADMVILNRNPIQDIRNSTSIDSVVVRGRLFNRHELDQLLADAKRLAAVS
jgi:imidazolonepropionase-like amidohydrolase